MKDYYELVKSIMEKYPDTRDDDMRLYAIVVHQRTRLKPDVAFYEAMYNHFRYDLPSYESVTRARRKVQEQEEALRGKKYNDRRSGRKSTESITREVRILLDKEAKMEIKLGFELALCVTSGEGFKKGIIYPIVGWNNGINIARTDENGDVFIFLACNGGVGKGDLNNFDDSGSPSFREIKEAENVSE